MEVILLVIMVAFSAAAPTNEQWESFKREYGKSYQSIEEEKFRMAIFMENLKMIEEHNAKYDAGLSTFYLKMYHFGDMLLEEVSLYGFNWSREEEHAPNFTLLPPTNVDIPESIDWRELGAVTRVKTKGICGSCWAFSSTGAIEGQLFRKTGKLISLSEQQLVDCSKGYHNFGCGGGYPDNSFSYLEDVEGLEGEDSYPYEGRASDCRYDKDKVVQGTRVKAYADIELKNDEALKAAVATVGPISITVSAGNEPFIYYKGGVFNGDGCNPSRLDHSVLLVGYGSENGQDFWIIKNSWGPNWGENGYMRLTRSKNNACGISSMASYPILQ